MGQKQIDQWIKTENPEIKGMYLDSADILQLSRIQTGKDCF